MRLLHTTTLEMSEFFASSTIPTFESQQLTSSESHNQNIPDYAILSHVWGPDELSFQDMIGERSLAKKKLGWKKLRDSCRQARRHEHEYIWIDTCCIDKTSSTELSEAINSMFQWYKGSVICYVYLPDVDIDNVVFFNDTDPSKTVLYNPNQDNATLDRRNELRLAYDRERKLQTFRSTVLSYSRWFTRGWTLQELLAPSKVEFYDNYWRPIGNKIDHLSLLSEITKIDLFALEGGDPQRLSIARRMSWVANRQTTRAEDMAYCILGIFNINMLLLYGEGAKAFIRLQEEILKVSNDQSLFAWMDPTRDYHREEYPEASHPQGLLAASPLVFQHSNTISQFYKETPNSASSASTNKGLRVEFLMCLDKTYASGLVYLAVLDCQIGNVPGIMPAIRLRRLISNGDQYARIDMPELLKMCSLDSRGGIDFQGFDPRKAKDRLIEMRLKVDYVDWTVQTIFIRQEPQFPLVPGFWLVPQDPFNDYHKVDVLAAYPPHLWDEDTRVLQPQPDLSHGTKKLGALVVDFRGTKCIIVFGVTYWELNPWCHIIPYRYGVYEPFYAVVKVEFNKFRVDKVQLPTNTETRAHEYVCDRLQLKTVIELKTVSGRDMHLIHLLSISDKHE